jgi:hypothetical protein
VSVEAEESPLLVAVTRILLVETVTDQEDESERKRERERERE